MKLLKSLLPLGLILGSLLDITGAAELKFGQSSVNAMSHELKRIDLLLSERLEEDIIVTFEYYNHGHMVPKQRDPIIITPLNPITFPAGITWVSFEIQTQHVGSVVIGVNSTSKKLEGLKKVVLTVFVVHSYTLVTLAEIMGWGFFAAWVFSVYPLVYTVLRTKSLAGISYGFISLNIISFLAYAIYTLSLYFARDIKNEYWLSHPQGVRPVQLQDVCLVIHFSLWFTILSCLCFWLDSGGQRVNGLLQAIIFGFIFYACIDFILAATKLISWLKCMYALAVIKMITMPLKYIPQIWQNFRRQSTEGFNVLFPWLDLCAGCLVVGQMVTIAANGDDWTSFYGNLPKLFLGMTSIIFDIILLVQHHIFYGGNEPYSDLKSERKSKKRPPANSYY